MNSLTFFERYVTHGKPDAIITPELIRKVYEVDCDVMRRPKTGKLNVVYYSNHREDIS